LIRNCLQYVQHLDFFFHSPVYFTFAQVLAEVGILVNVSCDA